MRFLNLTNDSVYYSYTYNGIEVTPDMIDKIINILVHENIPLSNVIVQIAIKKYINNSMQEYINYLHSLDNMLENSKMKKQYKVKCLEY